MTLKTSLVYQDECPKCGANWKALEESLYEGVLSENWYNAMKIIEHCAVCRKRFQDEVTFVNNKERRTR